MAWGGPAGRARGATRSRAAAATAATATATGGNRGAGGALCGAGGALRDPAWGWGSAPGHGGAGAGLGTAARGAGVTLPGDLCGGHRGPTRGWGFGKGLVTSAVLWGEGTSGVPAPWGPAVVAERFPSGARAVLVALGCSGTMGFSISPPHVPRPRLPGRVSLDITDQRDPSGCVHHSTEPLAAGRSGCTR